MSLSLRVCFILDHRLMHYRAPLFEHLSKLHQVTVIHRGPLIKGDWSFNQIIADYRTFGPFCHINRNLPQEIDVLVMMQNLHFIQSWLLPLMFWRRFALIFWGIGVSSARGLVRNKNLTSMMKDFLGSFADGIAFYSDYPLQFYSRRTLANAVVVGNTIASPHSENMAGCKKNCVLFIGTLDNRKGLELLFSVFARYLKGLSNNSEVRVLRVVGDGPKREELENLASLLNITDAVQFEGAVTDDAKKKTFFSSAAVTVSPLQAGLSVAESFSYGVPFITHKNPISGGEYLSIKDGVNGFLFATEHDLLECLLKIGCDSQERLRLGNNAFEFYRNNLQMYQFVERFDGLIRDSYARFIS